jgi:hypothetical protein
VTAVISPENRLPENLTVKPHIRFGHISELVLPALIAAVLLFPQVADAGSLTIAWVPNTQPELAGYKVCYGTASGQYSTQGDVGNVATYTIPNLATGTYYLAVKAYGKAGEQSGFSNEVVAVVSPPPDTTPPVISNVTSTSITTSSAMITWGTDEAADSQVFFGTTPQYGNSPGLNTAMVTSHVQLLNGLLPATTYYYYVVSKDAAGNAAASNAFTFATAVPGDTTPPPVPAITSNPSNPTNQTSASFGFTDTEVGVSFLCQLDGSGFSACSSPKAYSGLSQGSHAFSVKAQDAAGTQGNSANNSWTVDLTPPVLSQIRDSNVGSTSATILWTTDEVSDSMVEYGETDAYGSATSVNPSVTLSHTQTLNGLAGGKRYHYRVVSKDVAGNAAISGDYTFSTSAGADLTSGLVAAYAFDEGSGSTTADNSTNDIASIYSASWVGGKYGAALSFDGKKSYVEAPAGPLPNLNAPMTVSIWINVYNGGNRSETFAALANPASHASLQLASKGSQIGVLNSDSTWIVAGRLPSFKSWQHMAYVFDGQKNYLYINGILVSSSTLVLKSAPVTGFEIGRFIDGSGYYKGSIDEIRIFNRALNSDEINAAMNTPVSAVQASAMVDSSSVLTMDSMAESVEPSLPPYNAVVDLALDRQTYLPDETVNIDSLRISNLSEASAQVEFKAWLMLTNLLPISLGDLGTGEVLSLEPLSSQDFGPTTVLSLSSRSPSANGEVDVRLLDPVTGTSVSEDINPFTIDGLRSPHSKGRAHVRIAEKANIVLEAQPIGSRVQYTISNKDVASVAVEFKVWLESLSGGNPIPVISTGSDGSLVLPVGKAITLDPLAIQPVPAGEYRLKLRILDPATGEILIENETELIIGRQ